MSLTIENAKNILNPKDISKDLPSASLISMSRGFIEGWNQAIEKCAEIVDHRGHEEPITGWEEELTISRNLILSLKVKGGK